MRPESYHRIIVAIKAYDNENIGSTMKMIRTITEAAKDGTGEQSMAPVVCEKYFNDIMRIKGLYGSEDDWWRIATVVNTISQVLESEKYMYKSEHHLKR